jgi:DNA-binding response OmpR family regulator
MRTILVVDDEPIIRNLLVSYVEREGYRALDAAGCAEALELVRSFDETIHLAVIDHTLVDGSGLDLVKDLATLQPHLRVLLISGWEEERVMAGCTTSMVGFLAKPFTRKDLLDRIRQILGREGTAGAGNPN